MRDNITVSTTVTQTLSTGFSHKLL